MRVNEPSPGTWIDEEEANDKLALPTGFAPF